MLWGKEFLGIFELSVNFTPIYRYEFVPRRDCGPSGWKLAGVSLRTCWLGDLVGLIEDRRGSDLHNHRICPWLHGVIAQLLDLAINQDFDDAALD